MSERSRSIEKFCFSWILETGDLQPRPSFSEMLFKVQNLSKSGRLGSPLVWSDTSGKWNLWEKTLESRYPLLAKMRTFFC